MRPSLVLAALLVSAPCASTSPSPSGAGAGGNAPNRQTVVLRPGQSAAVPGTGVSVTFERVAGDSRCPTDVQCVWEGDATVVVRAAGGREDATVELHTSGRFDRSAFYEGVRIEFQRLDPQPVSTAPIEPSEYRATLVLTRP